MAMTRDDAAAVQARAVEVFGNATKAEIWFSRPNRALRGARPADLLDTDAGRRQVKDVLERLANGVFS
jgi:putative toxin-antitoxin system antitoxin component (TIGR02293 family)